MVEREVGRRRKARTIGIATVMAILVVATALSGRITHHGATQVADRGLSTPATTALLGGASPGGGRAVALPSPPGTGASTAPAAGPGSSAGDTTTDTTTEPPTSDPGTGTGVQSGGSSQTSTTPTSPATAPPAGSPTTTGPLPPPTTVTPTTVTPTTVTPTTVTPTTVTPTTVPSGTVKLTSGSSGTYNLTLGVTVEVELQPSCPGSTWTSPRSTHPAVLEPTASPPSTAAGEVVQWFITAATGSTRLTSTPVRGDVRHPGRAFRGPDQGGFVRSSPVRRQPHAPSGGQGNWSGKWSRRQTKQGEQMPRSRNYLLAAGALVGSLTMALGGSAGGPPVRTSRPHRPT